MIGQLPEKLEVGGIAYPINADFRIALNICAAFNDPELTDAEKCYICIMELYKGTPPAAHLQEAADKAYWFIGGGNIPVSRQQKAKILDWQQDEAIIFPAINKAAGFETRAVPFLHWWSFLGYFGEIGEGLLSQVLHIRQKKSRGKKLEKWESEFLREHRSMIELQKRYTKEEQAERDRLSALLD